MRETVITRLRNSCQRNPDRLALAFRPGFRFQRWTYSQLWEDVCRMSALMKDRGLQPGDRVLIQAPNCPQWVIAFFGVIKAGGILVPMDMRVSNQFVVDVIAQTTPISFITSQASTCGDAIGDVRRIQIEEISSLLAEKTPELGDLDGSAELAEILFTSGTTGRPKGVMLTHENLMASIDAASRHMPADSEFRLLSLLPLSHVFEQAGGMLMPLWCGASVTYATSRQPRRLFALMADSHPSMLLVVPQVLELFMNGIEQEVKRQGKTRIWTLTNRLSAKLPFSMRRHLFRSLHKKLGGSLKIIICGGARLPIEIANKWELVGVKIVQGYGATEAAPSIASSTYSDRRFDSLGKPLPGVDVRIADDGEIQIKGRNITPGYWNDPVSTVRAFDDGWLKTGDVGYFDKEGFLHLSGRIRHMIVLASGMNVFPEDIEQKIAATGLVCEVAVVGLPNEVDTEVHAVFPSSNAGIAADAVRIANTSLGDHQRIRGHSIWPTEELPKTHTLKLKKHEILEWLKIMGEGGGQNALKVTEQTNKASDPVKSAVARIANVSLQEISSEQMLGVDLNIDSLGRVELLADIEERTGTALDEAKITEATTINELKLMIVDSTGTSSVKIQKFPGWSRRWWARGIRGVLQTAVMSPAVRLAYRRTVNGRENLPDANKTVVFASNHNLYMDNSVILRSLPRSLRNRLAVAAAADNWNSRLLSIVYPIFGNAFPISRTGPIMPSLENLGKVLDSNWSVLIYPEGDLYIDKGIQPFKTGIGLIAVEGHVPVVPLRLKIRRYGRPKVFPFWRRGEVEVDFGAPMEFPTGTDYSDATRAIEEAVNSL